MRGDGIGEPAPSPGREAAAGDRAPTLVDVGRAVGVVFGGPIVLWAGVACSAVSVARSLAHGRAPGRIPILGMAAAVAYCRWVIPWLRGWGATESERRAELPGDALVPDPTLEATRAVTVDAPDADVWPWLAQIGQDRGGFYSYEWLENLAGCRLRNADRIHPEWQHRDVGDTIMLHPANGLEVSLFEPERAYGIKGWGVYALAAIDGGTRTRVLARARIRGVAAATFYASLVEIPHFVMERRMLLGLKERADGTRRGAC